MLKNKIFLLAATFVFVGIIATAQKRDSTRQVSFIIKLAPLVYGEPGQGIQMGFEAPISKKVSFQGEGAYYFDPIPLSFTRGFSEEDYISSNIFAVKSELRWYLKPVVGGMQGAYIAGQAQHKSIYQVAGYYKEIYTSDSIFFVDTMQTENVQITKVNFKFGYQAIFKGLVFDFYFGGGIRNGIYFIDGKREKDSYLTNEFPFNFMLGLRFGGAFR